MRALLGNGGEPDSQVQLGFDSRHSGVVLWRSVSRDSEGYGKDVGIAEMRRVRGVIGNVLVQVGADLHEKLEVDAYELQVGDVLVTAISVDVRSLRHELGEEVHPGLQVDVPSAVIGPWEIIHA